MRQGGLSNAAHPAVAVQLYGSVRSDQGLRAVRGAEWPENQTYLGSDIHGRCRQRRSQMHPVRKNSGMEHRLRRLGWPDTKPEGQDVSIRLR